MSVNNASNSTQEFTSSDAGELVSEKAIPLPSHQGRATSAKNLVQKQLGSKNLYDKLFEFQHVENFVVGGATPALTEFKSYTFSELLNPFMKVWLSLHNYMVADIHVQVVNAGNSGLSGTYLVGKRLPTSTASINELSDDDRTIRQFRSGAIFDLVLKPITNINKMTTPGMVSSIAVGQADIYYPCLSFMTHSNIETTFAASTLNAQFAIYTCFGPGSKFIQLGVPPSISLDTDDVETPNFINPQRLELSRFIPSNAKLYGDGAYGFNRVRTKNTAYSVFLPQPVVLNKWDNENNPTKLHMVENTNNAKIEHSQPATTLTGMNVIFNSKYLDEYEVEIPEQTLDFGYVINEGTSYKTEIKRPDLTSTNIKLFRKSGMPDVLSESLLVGSGGGLEVTDVAEGGSNPKYAVTIRGDTAQSNVISVAAVSAEAASSKSTYSMYGEAEVNWAEDGHIASYNLAHDIYLKPILSGGALTYRNDYQPNSSEKNHALDMTVKRLDFSFQIAPDFDENVIHTNGLLNLSKDMIVQLPTGCVSVNVSTRNIIPVVPKTVADQELPTIIPEISLFDILSKFYDPKRTFLLRFYDNVFNQLSFELIFSGPNKCVFVKSSNLSTQYFNLDKPLANYYIGQRIDLGSSSTIPASLVNIPIVDRTDSASVNKAKLKARPFKLRYEGNVASAVGIGGDALSKIIAVLEEKEESGMGNDTRLEIQKLIGEQGLQQLMAQIKANKEALVQQAELDDRSRALSNAATQNALGQSGVVNSSVKPGDPGDATIIPSIDEPAQQREAPPRYSTVDTNGPFVDSAQPSNGVSVASPAFSSQRGFRFDTSSLPEAHTLSGTMSGPTLLSDLRNSGLAFKENGFLTDGANNLLDQMPSAVQKMFGRV